MSTGQGEVFRRKILNYEQRSLSPAIDMPNRSEKGYMTTYSSRLRNSSSERKPSFLIKRSDSSSRSATDLNQYSTKLDDTVSKKSRKKDAGGAEFSVTTQVPKTHATALFKNKIELHHLKQPSNIKLHRHLGPYDEATDHSGLEKTGHTLQKSMRSLQHDQSATSGLDRLKTQHMSRVQKLIDEQGPRSSFKIMLKPSSSLYERLQAKTSSNLEFSSKPRPVLQLRDEKKARAGQRGETPKKVFVEIHGFTFQKKIYPNNKWLLGTNLKEKVKDVGIIQKQQISHDLFRLQRSLSLITNVRAQEMNIGLLQKRSKKSLYRKSTVSVSDLSKDNSVTRRMEEDSKSSDTNSEDFRTFDYVRPYNHIPSNCSAVYFNLEEAILGTLQYDLTKSDRNYRYLEEIIKNRSVDALRTIGNYISANPLTLKLSNFQPCAYHPLPVAPRTEFELLIRNKFTRGCEIYDKRFDQSAEAYETVTLWDFPIFKLLSKDFYEMLKIQEFDLPLLERRVLNKALIRTVFSGLADNVTEAMQLIKPFAKKKSPGNTVVGRALIGTADLALGDSQTSIDGGVFDAPRQRNGSRIFSMIELPPPHIDQVTKLKVTSKRMIAKSGFRPEGPDKSSLSPDKGTQTSKPDQQSIEKFWGQSNLSKKIFDLLLNSDQQNWEFYHTSFLDSNKEGQTKALIWLKIHEITKSNGFINQFASNQFISLRRMDSGKSARSRGSNKSVNTRKSSFSRRKGNQGSPNVTKQPILIIKPTLQDENTMDQLSPHRLTVGKLLAAEFFLNPHKRKPTSLSNRNIPTKEGQKKTEITLGQSRRNSMKKVDSEKSLSIDQQSGMRPAPTKNEGSNKLTTQASDNFEGIRMTSKISLNEPDDPNHRGGPKLHSHLNISSERAGSVGTANNLVRDC